VKYALAWKITDHAKDTDHSNKTKHTAKGYVTCGFGHLRVFANRFKERNGGHLAPLILCILLKEIRAGFTALAADYATFSIYYYIDHKIFLAS